MWQKYVWLMAAGSLGTLARWKAQELVAAFAGGSFPWGTVAVNLAGCGLFGCAWELAEKGIVLDRETRFYVLTGFMGAFTTFSTFAFDTGQLVAESRWLAAAANVALQNVAGVAALFLGGFAARQFA